MYFGDSVLATGAEIQHDISIDDGMTWRVVSPRYLHGTDPNAPEIININNIDSQKLPNDKSSINTEYSVTNFRYRIRMKKNPAMINDQALVPYYSPILRSLTLNVITEEL
jgi:hypothetical protein